MCSVHTGANAPIRTRHGGSRMSVHAGSSNVDEKIPDTNYASSGPVLTVLGLCGLVVALMQTLVVPIIPQLPHLLNSTPADTSWAVTATLLAAAVITPIR